MFLPIAMAIGATIGCGGGDHGSNPGGGPGSGPGTGGEASGFELTAVFPTATSRLVDTPLMISGTGITGAPTIRLTHCDQESTTYDLAAGPVTASAIPTTLAADPARVQGAYTVRVTNGDGQTASLPCALSIMAVSPPRVTLVVPNTAWQGMEYDAVNSDVTVSIQGTGFRSTPNVRWVSRDDPSVGFDAVFVGFVSESHLTAIVPSETHRMPVGTYDLFVTNPDQLSARWTIGAAPGDFTVTGTPPPQVADVSPARIQNGSCTSSPITIRGSDFLPGATAWYVAPAGTTCAGSSVDRNEHLLCPMPVDGVTSTTVTARFATCPALGPYPLVVTNPDDQSDYWYSIEITPSSDGHLNGGVFETQQARLETARWKHAVQFGFGVFSDAYVYAAGGQGRDKAVLGSVEVSQFNLFGVPGPFHHVEQYGGPAAPRVANDLTVPRAGATLVRVGKHLFSIGGTTARSDTSTVVAASSVVERAEILGYDQMPGVKAAVAQDPAGGLPMGSWYYRVSAIGPWGESLATREVVALNKRGTIEVCWLPPLAPGAVSYNIYRSLASDGRAGTSAAIAYEVRPENNCWLDTGVDSLAPAPGNARATLAAGGTFAAGSYSYRVSAVVPRVAGGTRETHAGYATTTTITADDVAAGRRAITLTWDALPIPGTVYRVYRLDPASGAYKLLEGSERRTTTSFTDPNTAFAASGATPVQEVLPLAPGSLSKWDATLPRLDEAREGLDGVAVRLEPEVEGGIVARIIVAGGRDGASGSYVYRTSAESLGVYADGTTEPAWSEEAPVFAHARGYYSLLSTQDRNVTPFPPPPAQPPCDDCDVIILRKTASALTTAEGAAAPAAEPVYLIAALGDDAYQVSSNTGRSDIEACPVDLETGHLVAGCGVPGGTTWVVQAKDASQVTFGHDALLYFSYLYPFYGVQRETLGAAGTTLQILGSSIARFPLMSDLANLIAGQILDSFQSASTSFVVHRAYYQMARLLSFVYVIGGYAEAHQENGAAIQAGPTDLVERHQQ